ncbi:MAG: 3-oxoacyl-[acyl-carrier-protein] reductase [Thermodesulfobacteria bacterium]|nr:3-oxoacyl-[acyl-carrier-protein] reductase [Thermodesulfobacteriota bacterium]
MCEKRLAGKNALVTGGSRGIGRAICLRLAQEGAHVAINYASNEDAAKEVLALIEADGGSGSLLPFDVANTSQVKEKISAFVKEKGPIQILVNNAGITRDGLLARMKEQDWDQVLSVNLKGAFNCVQACARDMMKARWGRIINIGSVVGTSGNPGQANYAAAKAGLEGFTKSVAKEMATRGITANVVAPGFIETDMTAVLPDKVKERLLGEIPLGRMGQAHEVAAAVSFLASEDASYITGHTLHVNGGLVCQ